MQARAAPGKFGGTVTVIYSAPSETPQKKPPSLLPLLVVLFLVSYAILTLLVVEQGRTIESQRTLLRDLLKDSTQLAALKGKLAREDAARKSGKPAAVQPRKDANPGNSGSARPKFPAGDARLPGKSARTTRQAPRKPAADLQDVRRFTREI
jgi:hypothetical protein